MKVYYRKSSMYNRAGYSFSTEYMDEVFFWGTLEEAKDGFSKRYGRRNRGNSTIEIEWIEIGR